jgi:hypothetical protein
MIQRILHSRHFIACLLSAATGMALYFRTPFPEDNIFLRVMAIRSESAFLFFKYSYTLFLYTTPYIVYSILLSGIYVFALKAGRKIRAGKLPLYSDPRKRRELSLVVGEVHHPRKQMPSETPRWLVIPERGLFTGIAIVGAVGSGKTASCMYPFVEQILAYRAERPDRRIGGLVLGEDPEDVIWQIAPSRSYEKSNWEPCRDRQCQMTTPSGPSAKQWRNSRACILADTGLRRGWGQESGAWPLERTNNKTTDLTQ